MKQVLKALIGLSVLSQMASAEQRVVIPVQITGQIYGYFVDTNKKELVIMAYSGGCLTKGDFVANVAETYPQQISIVQINENHCEAVPHPEKIVFTYKELDIGNNSIQVSSKSTTAL